MILFKQKIKAGALNYAIVLSIIVAVFCLGLLTLNRLSLFQQAKYTRQLNLDNKTDNMFSQMRASTLSQNVFEEDGYGLKTYGYSKVWGAYQLISVNSQDLNFYSKKTALIGALNKPLALWLKDQNKGLKICGNTLLQGTVYLPEKGIKTANIEGKHYERKKTVYGQFLKSEKQSHQIQADFVSAYSELFNSDFSQDSLIDLPQKATIFSWTNKQATLFAASLNLSFDSLEGHLLIYCEDSIIVENTSFLKDCFLIAPVIKFKRGFTGTVHALSTDTILIEDSVCLNYPSSLTLLDGSKNSTNPIILLGGNSKIDGTVTHIQEGFRRSFKPNVLIDKNAKVRGHVFCMGNLELRGDVFGSVWTTRFVLNTRASVYENHLLDCSIMQDSLPQPFAGMFFKSYSSTFPAKWLD